MPRIITLTPNPALDFSFEAEKIEPNRKLRCSEARTDPGGGGVNVARAATRLGADTLAIFTAGGVYGEALVKAVEKEKVAARVIAVASDTRPAFHAHDRSSGDEFRFNFPGAEITAAEAEAMLAALREETRRGDMIVGSGSLPAGAPDNFWARAARIAKNAGASLILDTTSGEDEALREGLFLLRKNKLEVSTIAGHTLDWPDEAAAFAKEFISKHAVEKLVVTHGGDGALMASANGVVRAPSMPVKIESAVGAGDSFVGALTVALMKGEPDEAALRFAMAAAGATLMTPGTALFDPAEVKRLFLDANHAGR